MKKLILGAISAALMSTAAHAENIGVSMALFDDNFLTVLRNGMNEYAKTKDDVTLQIEDAQNDVLETKEVCRLLGDKGKNPARIYIMMGELSNQAAVMRTQDIKDVMTSGDCQVELQVIDEQTANWSRDEAQDLMTNWLSTGEPFDALISNNDEMAIGAIQAMKAANISMDEVIVAGVDATQDALAAMEAGDLDVTVFQDAAGQGKGAVDAALKLARGESVDQKVYIPFQLVTPDTMSEYKSKN